MGDGDFESWAEFEFGTARLGDSRRVTRLLRCAAQAAARPAGKITAVFDDGAEREAAFRLIENEAVDAQEIARAAHRACAARCADFSYVFVPTDGSSLNITDARREKRLGTVGARSKGAQGLQVMSAIAVSPDGVPLGLCGQVFWARQRRSRRSAGKHDRRRVGEKETRYGLEVMTQTRSAFASLAPKTQPWFQLDRGGDAWPVVLAGLAPGQLFTVRAAYDRRLWEEEAEPERRYLRQAIEAASVLGTYELEVVAGPHRQARRACMEVRAAPVTLRLEDERSKRLCPAELYAVLAREVTPVPSCEEPLEWLLLTSYPTATMAAAGRVLEGYTQRWRIEEFHRVWKTGACRVEDTQLGERDHIVRWALVLASVAMRILRLTYLSRHQPHLPATFEFETVEADAVVLLRAPATKVEGTPTIGEITRWLAELGGYTGKSSGGPPGALVIARGLARIEPIVKLLRTGLKM
jgi:hypothetical protein